ncbi:MAG: ABC transporter ATP-binding protein [Desulfofustis sp. PB-SRB1]|jgi:lipoprotein-releasing system ATP-binding protein|nr:ABC transporter ATP-binding protein [Desulfofustis sp. PB-SRB1]MBM1001113.1 ABC transporter ATP-binding protein [Desulfofustis sp. PB-SRB1]HBH29321.1 ABC transporter ATP-binding protein [Desulfofustis sp.]
MNNALLEAAKIGKVYDNGSLTVEVLKGVGLTVSHGEMIAVVGASGSGKTTLLQILGTLAAPSSGKLSYCGERLDTKPERNLAQFRNRHIGFVFQFHHLLPEFSALENTMMPALINGTSRQKAALAAQELLTQVELDTRMHHRTGELSGGEQQRTALARALIMQPSLLLADEPTGNLDRRAGDIVFSLLHDLCRQRGLAVVMATHNEDLARRMDRRLTLADGLLS